MREIMILFYGNELSAGLCLFSWLLWTAAGAFAGAGVAGRIATRPSVLPTMLLASTALLPATVVLSRVAKTIVGISQGEIIGIVPMAAIASVVLLPFCFVSGMIFPLLIRAGSADTRGDRDVPARIYLLESVGSSAFGIITALFLIRYFDALTIAFLIAVAGCLASLYISVSVRRAPLAVLSVLALCLFVLLPLLSRPDIGAITRQLQWKGFAMVESTDSVYGNLTVIKDESQISVYDSGILSFTYPDVVNSELGVIYPLLLHPRPARVLLVGGGISSTLSQILKHPSVEKIDYVELDPALIDLGMRNLPPDATRPLADRRVRVIHRDGRLFVRECRDRYDVIIVNMADPVNARINRYFTREFFGEAKRVLTPGGVFSISVGSSEEIISPVLASFLGSISRTLGMVFAYTAVVPGGTAFFIASDLPSKLDLDPAVLAARMRDRNISNSYVTEQYLLYQLNDKRVGYVRRAIEGADPAGINADLSPSVYYYDMVLRSYWLSPGLKIAIAGFAGSRPFLPAAAIITAAVAYGAFLGILSRKRQSLPTATVVPAALTSGFTEIALTVVIIIAFQTLHGYVYSGLGLIVSSFMIGLAVGTAAARSRIGKVGSPWRLMIAVQLSYGALCLLVVGVLLFFSKAGSVEWPQGPVIVFSFLNMLCGILAALHYVTAVRFLSAPGAPARGGGWVYGMNLAGATAGAVVASVVLVPLWGLVATLLLVLAANVCAAGVVVAAMRYIQTK